MNADAGTDGSHPYVALSGRVPCKVEGPVSKGQRLVSAATPGVAKGVTDTITALSIVGRALEDKTDEGVSIIEIVVGKN